MTYEIMWLITAKSNCSVFSFKNSSQMDEKANFISCDSKEQITF